MLLSSWAYTIYACNIVPFDNDKLARMLAEIMDVDELWCIKFVEKYKIVVSNVYATDYEDGNITIDWSKGKRMVVGRSGI